MNNTPYDTGKVKIGLLYTPPPPIVTPEDTWAQSVLLGDRYDFADLVLSTIQSLLAIVVLVLVVTLLGGLFNA